MLSIDTSCRSRQDSISIWPSCPSPSTQDSLGGNAYICIIACVSGEPADMEETLLTLKYAAGARRIKGAPTITKKVRSACLAEYLRFWMAQGT